MPLFKKLKKDIGVRDDDDKDDGKKEEKEEKEERETEEQKEAPQDENNWMESEGQLAVDVFQEQGKFIVEAPIAGVDPEDIEVFIEEGALVIKGSRQKSASQETRKYFYQECYWGGFRREIILPEDVDTSKIDAQFKNGILRVEIPQAVAKQRKHINIRVGD